MGNERSRPARADKRTEIFSANLRKALADRNWQQADLAQATQLGRDAVNRYANGINLPPLKKIVIIAEALSLQPSELDPEFPEGFKVAQSPSSLATGEYGLRASAVPGKLRLTVDVDVSHDTGAAVLKLIDDDRSRR